MRICLLGDFTGNPDEGMKNVSRNIRDRLALKHDIMAINPRDILIRTILRNIRSFRPEIIHYLHGPTIRSLIILKLAKLLSGNNARTVCSATKPYFSKVTRHFLPLLRPDLILTQSLIWEEFFSRHDYKVKFFPNGVDTSKFSPATGDEKRKLRKKWGISYDKFVALHVGHIRKNRNLEVFKRIQKIPGLQVVIVGGTTNHANKALKDELVSANCKVYHRYIDNISDLYKMADLYVFPTKYDHKKLPESYNKVGAIDLPLSILEAMSCNLPVITTPFGALPRIFIEGNGLYYFQSVKELVAKLHEVKRKKSVETRMMIKSYDWNYIIDKLDKVYEEILS